MKPEAYRSSRAGQAVRTKMGYWAFVPAPLPPDLHWTPALVTILAEAERNLSKLAGLGSVLPSSALLIQPMVRRDAVLSIATWVTLRASSGSAALSGCRAACQYCLRQLALLPDTACSGTRSVPGEGPSAPSVF